MCEVAGATQLRTSEVFGAKQPKSSGNCSRAVLTTMMCAATTSRPPRPPPPAHPHPGVGCRRVVAAARPAVGSPQSQRPRRSHRRCSTAEHRVKTRSSEGIVCKRSWPPEHERVVAQHPHRHALAVLGPAGRCGCAVGGAACHRTETPLRDCALRLTPQITSEASDGGAFQGAS